ncbi:MAG: thioesterase family protein [Cyanobacteria bacterium J06632_3]
MPYCHSRVIRFHETDAAGVVYFANLLTLCHEAYEAALAAGGFVLSDFFSAADDFAVPIVHTEADFYRPLRCGDRIQIQLTPKQLTPHSFEIAYALYPEAASSEPASSKPSSSAPSASPSTSQGAISKPLATALTRHVCISPQMRHRQALTPELIRWIATLAAPTPSTD